MQAVAESGVDQDYSKQVVRYREGRLREFGTGVLFTEPRLLLPQQGSKLTPPAFSKSQKTLLTVTSLSPLLRKYQRRWERKLLMVTALFCLLLLAL